MVKLVRTRYSECQQSYYSQSNVTMTDGSLIPFIYKILSQKCYRCVQYTKYHNMNIISDHQNQFKQRWLI